MDDGVARLFSGTPLNDKPHDRRENVVLAAAAQKLAIAAFHGDDGILDEADCLATDR